MRRYISVIIVLCLLPQFAQGSEKEYIGDIIRFAGRRLNDREKGLETIEQYLNYHGIDYQHDYITLPEDPEERASVKAAIESIRKIIIPLGLNVNVYEFSDQASFDSILSLCLGNKMELDGKTQEMLGALASENKVSVAYTHSSKYFNNESINLTGITSSTYIRDYAVVPIGGKADNDPEIGYYFYGYQMNLRPTILNGEILLFFALSFTDLLDEDFYYLKNTVVLQLPKLHTTSISSTAVIKPGRTYAIAMYDLEKPVVVTVSVDCEEIPYNTVIKDSITGTVLIDFPFWYPLYPVPLLSEHYGGYLGNDPGYYYGLDKIMDKLANPSLEYLSDLPGNITIKKDMSALTHSQGIPDHAVLLGGGSPQASAFLSRFCILGENIWSDPEYLKESILGRSEGEVEALYTMLLLKIPGLTQQTPDNIKTFLDSYSSSNTIITLSSTTVDDHANSENRSQHKNLHMLGTWNYPSSASGVYEQPYIIDMNVAGGGDTVLSDPVPRRVEYGFSFFLDRAGRTDPQKMAISCLKDISIGKIDIVTTIGGSRIHSFNHSAISNSREISRLPSTGQTILTTTNKDGEYRVYKVHITE